MLRVKIDIVPFGAEDQTRQIGELIIGNVGRGSDGHNYIAHYIDDSGNELTGKLLNYDRKQILLEIVRRCSEVLLLEENTLSKQEIEFISTKNTMVKNGQNKKRK